MKVRGASGVLCGTATFALRFQPDHAPNLHSVCGNHFLAVNPASGSLFSRPPDSQLG